MSTSQRRQREKEDLRKRILDAAREIVISRGFDALTIRKVADAVEYAPGTLYLYFENRDAIARALCREVYSAMHDAILPALKSRNPQKRLRAFVQSYIDFALSQPELYRLALIPDPAFSDVLLRDGPVESEGDPGRRLFQLLIETVAELRQSETNAFAFAEMVWVAVHGLVSLRIVCHAFPVTPVPELSKILTNTLLAGILQKNAAAEIKKRAPKT